MFVSGLSRVKLFGLTGGIGSGKSRVAQFLKKRMGFGYIDSDEVCRELLEPKNEGWVALQNAFGDEFFNPDSSINRTFLRKILFDDESFRVKLNTLLHPLAKDFILRQLHEKTDSPEIRRDYIVEVPLLFEAKWDDMFDGIITVYAEYSQCLERLMVRDKISPSDAQKALAAQESLETKALKADHVIDNTGPWPETCLQLIHLGRILGHELRKGLET